MGFLDRIKSFLNKEVEIYILDFQKAKRLNKKDLPEVNIKGVVLDSSERKVMEVGCSRAVTHPHGWIASVSNRDHVKTHLVLLEGSDERVILITKPEGLDNGAGSS